MTQNCDRCGHVIRFEVKRFGAFTLDSRCHRTVITAAFDTLTDAISANWMMYRISFGTEYRAVWRDRLRNLIAEYRQLSY